MTVSLKVSCGLGLVWALTLSGCATTRPTEGFSPEGLSARVCEQGGDFRKVTGSVWAKVESRELKGQFPATFLADSRGVLALEITDLIGTPQAWLKLAPGQEPQLRLSAEQERKSRVDPERAWAGLPFQFAPTLFLGKMPCPPAQRDRVLTRVLRSDGTLEMRERELRTKLERIYVYQFRRFGQEPWADQLDYRLELQGKVLSRVQIRFEDPQDPGGFPKRWTAESDQGSIQIRWKDRSPES